MILSTYVGRMVLYFSIPGYVGGHAIYAHILYDEKNNVKRVIIQDPSLDHNENKSGYVSQTKPNENLNKLLKGNRVQFDNGRILEVVSAIMIRDDKFGDYWKNKSLPLKFEERKYF